MNNIVTTICQQNKINAQDIRVLRGGQVNQVYLVNNQFVVRIGTREGALQRLTRETELLRSLAGQVPVPRILAFGEQNEQVYQIQQFIPGEKLVSIWKDLRVSAQESILAELAAHLQVLHSRSFPQFGRPQPDAQPCASWAEFLADDLQHTLEEIKALNIRMVPGYQELALDYFNEYKHTLQRGVPTLVHGDLSMGNILVDNGRISAIVDFEYSLHAPLDYELWVMEAFCLYPNDYAEEDRETYCSADFAGFIPLLRKHYPALFQVPFLRERVDCYHLAAALRDYLAWRKDNLSTIPPERMAAKEFYMARITNFTFRRGARMF